MHLPKTNFQTLDYQEIPVKEFQAYWPNFTPKEMACRKTGALHIDVAFMDKLQALRSALNRPLIINSGYRSPKHNAEVSSTGKEDGPHVRARAADIHTPTAHSVYYLVKAALALDFTCFAINWEKHFVHLDICQLPTDNFLGPYDRPITFKY